MEYYADISTDQFEKIREHETKDLFLPLSLAQKLTGNSDYPCFKAGEGLKLYHPSAFPEALRVEIRSVEDDGDPETIHLTVELNEWMMAFPDDSE